MSAPLNLPDARGTRHRIGLEIIGLVALVALAIGSFRLWDPPIPYVHTAIIALFATGLLASVGSPVTRRLLPTSAALDLVSKAWPNRSVEWVFGYSPRPVRVVLMAASYAIFAVLAVVVDEPVRGQGFGIELATILGDWRPCVALLACSMVVVWPSGRRVTAYAAIDGAIYAVEQAHEGVRALEVGPIRELEVERCAGRSGFGGRRLWRNGTHVAIVRGRAPLHRLGVRPRDDRRRRTHEP